MARSDVLVTADWAQSNLDAAGVVFVEVDEDASAYDVGHIAGAVKLDWRDDLQDPIKRDFVDQQQFSKLLSDKGIDNDDTVVLYGGNKSDADLEELYAAAGLDGSKETIAYCRIGERSSHTWFVLHELLGHGGVKNYDGSWTEYGSLVGAPIELGS